MTEISLAINEQDCTTSDGNTAEEFEAIAVTLLRAAEALRNHEEGKLECFGPDGKPLAWVHLHTCGPDCNDDALSHPPAIARFDSMRTPNQSLRALSSSMIEQYRCLSTQ
jgi:hypothetical protein